MASIGDFVATFRADFDAFLAPLKATQKEAQQFQRSLRPLTDSMKAIGTVAAATGGAVVTSFVAMSKAAANYGDSIRDASIRTGATTESLSGLKFAAEQSGTSFEAVSTGLRFLARNAAAGSDEFRRLGISVKDTQGAVRPVNDLFLDTADKLSKMRDGTEKTAVILKLFGRSGVELTEILNLGRVGIAGFTADAQEMGLILGRDAVEQADAFNDSLNKVKNATLGLSVTIGNALLPAMTSLANKTIDVVKEFRSWAAEYPGLIRLTGGLAAGIAGAGGLIVITAVLIAHIKELRGALALLLSPISLTIGAIVGLTATAVAFREEISSGLLRVGALMADAFAVMASNAAKLASALGLSGLAGKLKEAQFSLEESAIQWKVQSKSLLENTGIVIGNTAAQEKLRKEQLETLRLTAEATKKFKEAVDAIVQSVTHQGTKTAELVAALKILTAAHVPAVDITDQLGKQIMETVDALERQGKAVDPVLRKIYDLATAEQVLRNEIILRGDVAIQAAATMAEQNILFGKMEAAYSKFNSTISEAVRHQIEWDEAVRASFDAGLSFQENLNRTNIELDKRVALQRAILALDTPGSLLPSPKIELGGDVAGAKARQQALQDQIALIKGSEDLKKAIEDVRQSAGHVFDDMLIKGQGVFSSLANALKGGALSLGRAIFQDITAALLGPVKKAFDDLFKDISSRLVKGLGDALSGIFSTSIKKGAGGFEQGGGPTVPGSSTGIGSAVSGGFGAALREAGKAALVGGAIATATAIAVKGLQSLANAIGGLFGQGRKQADSFIAEFQAPFNQAVIDLHDSFFAAAEAGTLTVDAANSARASLTELWTDFKRQASEFAALGPNQAKVVKQAMDTLTANWGEGLSTIFAGMDSVTATIKETAAELERLTSITDLTDRVLGSASGFQDMEQALANLIETGMDWTGIVEILGPDILSLAHNIELLHMTVPPYIQAVVDQINANKAAAEAVEKLVEAMERHKEVTAELADVHTQLVEAVVSKLDLLERGIEESQNSIEGWTEQIRDVNRSIEETAGTLSDAKHWQDVYTDAIRESFDELKRLTDKRKSLEEQIAKLEISQKRDVLVAALDAAKANASATESMIRTTRTGIDAQGHAWTSIDTQIKAASQGVGAIADAQRALDEFDAAQRKNEMVERVSQLAELKKQLTETIAQEGAAKVAHDAAILSAVALVRTEKERLQAQLDADFALRKSLVDKILLEREHIASMEAERKATLAMFDALNGVRKTELQVMDDTISALLLRADALNTERIALEGLTGLTSEVSNSIAAMIADVQAAVATARTAATVPAPPVIATPPMAPVLTPAAVPEVPRAPAAAIVGPVWETPFGLSTVQPNRVTPNQPTVNTYEMNVNIENVHGTDANAVRDFMDKINREMKAGSATLIASEVRK